VETKKQVTVRVVHPADLTDETAQSTGIARRAAIDNSSVGAERLWMGHAVCHANMMSEPHHHGEAETASHILSGRFQVYFGENFEEVVEFGPGDFCFIPAHMPHIEANPYDESAEVIFARAPDNIVVTLPEVPGFEPKRLHP
jgi:uncharacterized RmlC-like cupin family protein